MQKKVMLRILVFAAAAAGLACWRPVSWLSLGTLEWWYHPETAAVPEDVGAIVVLSGGDVEARYEHAARIYRHTPVPVLASVGRGASPAATAHCVDLARRILREAGVPASMIWIEGRAANTHEDAKYAAEVLSRKQVRKVILVTEAYHALRADMSFR
ncbi:MAG TPA: YdcF family protein, partial [Bryobacteraceae bacterium]|nr:YdcF family protein [Bryobacteraceae bacterium]